MDASPSGGPPLPFPTPPAARSALVLAHGNLQLRPEELQVFVAGARVGLTVREFQVLHALIERPDRVVRRGELYRRVWGGDMKRRDRSVDVFVRKVRNKLAVVSPQWIYIHTHFGIGYRFAPVAPVAPEADAPGEPARSSRPEPAAGPATD